MYTTYKYNNYKQLEHYSNITSARLFALATVGQKWSATVPVYNLISLAWLIKIFNHQYSSNQVWWTLGQCKEKADDCILITVFYLVNLINYVYTH